jgi:hypothetical protein
VTCYNSGFFATPKPLLSRQIFVILVVFVPDKKYETVGVIHSIVKTHLQTTSCFSSALLASYSDLSIGPC